MTKENASDMIIRLVNGGALLDYRTRDGLTPVHKAAVSGQAVSVKVHCKVTADMSTLYTHRLPPVAHQGCCSVLSHTLQKWASHKIFMLTKINDGNLQNLHCTAHVQQ